MNNLYICNKVDECAVLSRLDETPRSTNPYCGLKRDRGHAVPHYNGGVKKHIACGIVACKEYPELNAVCVPVKEAKHESANDL